MKKYVAATLASLLLCSVAMAQSPQEALPGAEADAMFAIDTPHFLAMVRSSNEFEIQSSTLAEQKAPDAMVKTFATQMIADHTKAAQDLTAALEAGGVAAPAAPSLSPKHAAMLALLEAAESADFQMLYVDMQAVAHMQAVDVMRTFAKGGDNEAVQAFAAEKLPVLVMHKEHIGEIVAAQ